MAVSAPSAPASAGVTDGQRMRVCRLATGSVVVMTTMYPAGNGKAMANSDAAEKVIANGAPGV